MQRHALSLLTVGSVLGLTMGAGASTDTDVINELRDQVSALQNEVNSLRNSSDDNWMTEQRAKEIRSLVHDVLADADTRASLLQSGMSAGHDGRFFLASSDGNFRLNIAGRTQLRYVYNYQDSSPEDDHRSGFELRRTRLNFTGHVVNPSWTYQIQGDFSRSGGGFSLLDGWLAYTMDNGIRVRGGQFRPGFFYEDSNSSARQQAVERSLVNAAFAQGRTQGIEFSGSAGDNVRWSAMYSEGFSNNTGFFGGGNNTAALARTTEYAFSGRVDFLAAGNWRQFRDFSSWSDEEFGARLGAGLIWQKEEFGTTDDGEVETLRWTVDASVAFGGANVFAAFVGNHENTNGGGSVDQYGLVVQGGFFFVPDEWEAFARYEWGDADSASVKDLSVITFGATRYFAGHNANWTTDIGIGINEVDSFWASSGAGWRADADGEDTQLVIRSQFQLAF